MSFYADIYNDLPLRCGRLWAEMRESPVAKELDVTFMLMAASAGFATAWEQLKIQPGQGDQHSGRHPAFFGYKPDMYRKSLEVVNKELNKTLGVSSLFERANFAHWLKGQVAEIGDIRDTVEMRSVASDNCSESKVRSVIKVLRNAIAHNNLYAFARNRMGLSPDNDISEITFFSEAKESNTVLGYDFISMPVADFKNFLDSWFLLLKRSQSKSQHLHLVLADAISENNERFAA
jgi:hypothetical protein